MYIAGYVLPVLRSRSSIAFLYPAFSFLINSLFEILMDRTLGKLMLNQVVLNRSGKKAEAGQIFLRNLIKMLGVFVLVFAMLQDLCTNLPVGCKRAHL